MPPVTTPAERLADAPSSRYQLFPALTPAAYEALRADIAVRGILVAIELDEAGAILDGHHRAQIASELGITTYPRVVRAGLSEAEKISHVRALNLHRRHLSAAERAPHVVALRRDGLSTRLIARATGLSQSQVVRDLASVDPGDSPGRRVTGADGRRYPARRGPSVVAQTRAEQARALSALAALGAGAPGRPLDLRRAERLARDARAHARRTGDTQTTTSTVTPGCRVVHGDFRDLDLAPGTVDLILCDPPYDRAAIDGTLWADLGERAATWLRPGGLLLGYCGQMHLPQAIAALSSSPLDYWWLHAVVHDTGSGVAQVRQRGLGCAWRPVVVFRAPGGPDLPPWTVDTSTAGRRAKSSGHAWEQSEGDVTRWIADLTDPGDLILDPCCGSGAFPTAALRLGRQVVACDIDAASVALTRDRLATITSAPQ